MELSKKSSCYYDEINDKLYIECNLCQSISYKDNYQPHIPYTKSIISGVGRKFGENNKYSVWVKTINLKYD